ncbi:ribonuclease Z [Mucilaginibacter sp.]|uniref:ribonuclease Z n=1 Tax=Mucilaginibacter sp. TaxID=1882438 RepID=UPI000CC1A435|nr:ribonuclease Z [Mucilaginibacter sp.]PLW88688.1 MAG: ribonuclease Z [Mucilaginibacter sp.]PMP65631.1 MAG: ribonuclease Z [Mucilaginibacter sp.]HEK21485.1 ribonuclease Z [Bacteroidota bacterium]
MKFEVTILGSSSATPIFNRNPTAQVVNVNDKLYLIDCAEGTQQQMMRFDVKPSRIDHVFISHLHGDHYLGLIGLLSSMHLNGRKKGLKLFCPAPLKEIIEIQLKYSETTLNYPIDYVFTDPSQKAQIFENQDICVETIPLDHRVPCTGFLFKQKKRMRKLIMERVEQIGIPVPYYTSIKKGLDYEAPDGTIYKNDLLSMAPSPPKSYAYVSDTKYNPQYFKQINNVTVLYHEATFMHDMLDRANQTHHTTALQAAQVANEVNAERLLIGHFSARYKTLNELLEEAQSVFPATELATEGKTFVISE